MWRRDKRGVSDRPVRLRHAPRCAAGAGEIGATIGVAFRLPTTLGVVEIGFDALLCTVAQDESNQSYIHGVKFATPIRPKR